MKKFIYSLAIAGLFTPALQARTLSADEAKANVDAFTRGGMLKAPSMQSGLHLTATLNHDNVPTLYLFTNAFGTGLVVASASDLTAPVLGYTDTPFDPANIPPSMQALLDDYSSEIAWAETSGLKEVSFAAAAERETIEPLCKTQWNQNAPYNDLTPALSGQHCMTGCVATAMAQVMKVHEWPAEHGEGFISYLWSAGAQQLSYNLANSVMDWDNMLNTYDSNATAEQNAAVASLMRDCGYATEMQYSLSASGTTAIKIPTAFYYNFGYDKAVRTLQRAYYTLSDWENIVYTELQNGRPVIFTGVSNAQGGHCFVCDGYSSNRYYHINWGWGGMSDGYFLLTALNPATQGIGGSTGGFNNYVNICVGIQKPVEGSVMFTEIIGNGAFTTSAPSYSQNQEVIFGCESFMNTSMETENATFGVKLTSQQGEVSYISCGQPVAIESYEEVAQYAIPASQFPASGTYTVTPAWYNNDTSTWDDIHFPINQVGAFTLTAEGGTLTFSPVSVDADLEVTDVKILTDIYTNTNFQVSAKLNNNGDTEYLGQIMVAVVNSEGEVKANTAPFNVDIEGGTTQDLNFVAKFMRAPSAGTYSFCFITPAGKVLSEPMQVELTAVTGSTSIALEDLRMTSGDGGATPTVPSNDVSVAGTLRCKSGYFNNTLNAYIFPERGGSSLGTIGAETFFLHANHTAEFSMHGSFGNGIIGTTYMIGFFNGQVQVPGSLYFKLGEPSSVQAIDTPAEVAIMVSGTTLSVTGTESASIDVYSADGAHIFRVNGMKADISSLQPGAYIAVARTPAGPVMMKFIR